MASSFRPSRLVLLQKDNYNVLLYKTTYFQYISPILVSLLILSGIVLSILQGYPSYEKFVGCDNTTLIEQVHFICDNITLIDGYISYDNMHLFVVSMCCEPNNVSPPIGSCA